MLLLPNPEKQAIEKHGESGYPDEICGFILGTTKGKTKTVTRLLPIENSWDDTGASEFAAAGADFSSASRRRRFTIPPDEYYAADADAREHGETILGFYHSHPDHPAQPSSYDLRLAQEIFPGYSYIIVAVHQGRAADMTSWVLRDDSSQFDAEPIRHPAHETENL